MQSCDATMETLVFTSETACCNKQRSIDLLPVVKESELPLVSERTVEGIGGLIESDRLRSLSANVPTLAELVVSVVVELVF